MKLTSNKPISFKIRLTEEEYNHLRSAADFNVMSVAGYVRYLIKKDKLRYGVQHNENKQINLNDIV